MQPDLKQKFDVEMMTLDGLNEEVKQDLCSIITATNKKHFLFKEPKQSGSVAVCSVMKTEGREVKSHLQHK